MINSRKNRGSVLLLVVGLLTMVAMLGSTFLISAYMTAQQTSFVASQTSIQPLVMGSLSNFEELMKRDLCVGTAGPYSGVKAGGWGSGPEGWRNYADHASSAFDFWLSTTGGSEKDRGKATVWIGMPLGPGAVAISGAGGSGSSGGGSVGRLMSNTADGALIDGGVGRSFEGSNPFVVAKSRGLMIDTNGDGLDDAFLNNASVTNSVGEAYYYAARVTDTSGLVNVNKAAFPNYDSPAEPFDATRIDLRRLIGDDGLYGDLVGLRGGSGKFVGTFPLSDELFLRINNHANLAAFDESELYEQVGSELGDRMYDLTTYSASLKWMRHPDIGSLDPDDADDDSDDKPEDRLRVNLDGANLSGGSGTYAMLSRIHSRVNLAMGTLREGGDGSGGGGDDEGTEVTIIIDDPMGNLGTSPGVSRGQWPPSTGETGLVAYGGGYKGASSGTFPYYVTHHTTGKYKLYAQAPPISKAPSGVTVSVQYTGTSGTLTETFDWKQNDPGSAGKWVFLGQLSQEVQGGTDDDGDGLAEAMDFGKIMMVTIMASSEVGTITVADAIKVVRVPDAGDGGGGGAGDDPGVIYGVEEEYEVPGILGGSTATGPGSAEASHFVANMWAYMNNPGNGSKETQTYSFDPNEVESEFVAPNSSQWCAYGTVPQLVISEVFVLMKKDDGEVDGDDSEQTYAIELYNPTSESIGLQNYILYCGAGEGWSFDDELSTNSLGAGRRIVLYGQSHGVDGAMPTVDTGGTECAPLVNFYKAPVALYRVVDGMQIPVDSVHGQELLENYALQSPGSTLGVTADGLGAMSDDSRAEADISLAAMRDDKPERDRALIPLYVLRYEEDSTAEPRDTLGGSNTEGGEALTDEEIEDSELVMIYHGFGVRRLAPGGDIKSVSDLSDCLIVGPDNNGWDLPHKLIGQRFKGYISGETAWSVKFQHLGRRYAVMDDETLSRGRAHIGFINQKPNLYPDVPWATLLPEFIDVAPVETPLAEGAGSPSTSTEKWLEASCVPGRLNINTATTNTLMHLPWPGDRVGEETMFQVDVGDLARDMGLNVSGEVYIEIDPGDIATEIMTYRDGSPGPVQRVNYTVGSGAFTQDTFGDFNKYTRSSNWHGMIDPGSAPIDSDDSHALRAGIGDPGMGFDAKGYSPCAIEGNADEAVVRAFTEIPGFLTPGEIAMPLASYMDRRLTEEFIEADGSQYLGPNWGGPGVAASAQDIRQAAHYLDVRDALYASVIDSVTVSSTTFAVTSAVLRGKTVLPNNMEQYISVIDRTSCMDGEGKPEVLLHIRLDDQIVIED